MEAERDAEAFAALTGYLDRRLFNHPLVAAIKAAEAKAADYARLAGYRGAELVSISEGGAVGGPVPMPRAQMMAAEAKSTPVEPGQVGNTLTLSFQYRLVR